MSVACYVGWFDAMRRTMLKKTPGGGLGGGGDGGGGAGGGLGGGDGGGLGGGDGGGLGGGGDGGGGLGGGEGLRICAKRQICSTENAHIGSVLPPTVGINPPDICSGYGRMQWGKSGSTQGTVGKSIWNCQNNCVLQLLERT